MSVLVHLILSISRSGLCSFQGVPLFKALRTSAFLRQGGLFILGPVFAGPEEAEGLAGGRQLRLGGLAASGRAGIPN